MPVGLIADLNRTAANVTGSAVSLSERDWSMNLAGNHRAEFRITDLVIGDFDAHSFLLQIARRFLEKAPNRFINVNREIDPSNGAIKIIVQDVWINDMVAGDFNPIHHHPHCDLSCVGFLSVPDGYDQELSSLPAHKSVAGYLQFVDGRPSLGAEAIWQVKPRVGDFYMFPSWLMHCVYPFRSAGVRRSFSANLSVALESKG